MDGGFLKAQDCGLEKPYVCMTAPLYKAPDKECPRDHHSFKGQCLRWVEGMGVAPRGPEMCCKSEEPKGNPS